MNARHQTLRDSLRRAQGVAAEIQKNEARDLFERQVQRGRERAAAYGLPGKNQWPEQPTIATIKAWMAVRGTSNCPDYDAMVILIWLREEAMRKFFFQNS